MFEKRASTIVTIIDIPQDVDGAADSFDDCHILAGPAEPRMLRTGGQETEIEPLGRESTRCHCMGTIIDLF